MRDVLGVKILLYTRSKLREAYVSGEVRMTNDRVQPRMSPTLSFSGMYQKSFIYRRNRNNSQ